MVLFTSVPIDYPDDQENYQQESFFDGKIICKADVTAPSSTLIKDSRERCLQVIDPRFVQYYNHADIVVADNQCADLSPFAEKEPHELESISFESCQIEDFQLRHLQHLTGLRRIDLSRTTVSEFGLVYLRGLTGLQTVILNGTETNDLGLNFLSGLNLWHLYFKNTLVTDAGLSMLKTLPNLRNIALPHAITDNGLAMLAGLPLNGLDLSASTGISNDGLLHCRALPQLKSLYLPAQITDDGLKHLASLRLTSIGLGPESLTSAEGRSAILSSGAATDVSYPINVA